ncbi:MAG: hypothetical protein ACRD7E_05095 [Bryobacteraceae bacterium]
MSSVKVSHYLLSLPERVLRSASAVAGGLAREIGDAAVPSALRRTLLYQQMVESTLRFLIEKVGQVEGTYPSETKLAEDFLIRRTAGNGLEIVGVLAFHASPVWVMAALADVTGAGRKLIQEIAASLQQEGLLEADASFENVDQMLDGLEKSAARVSEAFNTPPLDVEGLRREWAEIRNQVAGIPRPNLPSPELLWKQWRDLQQEAALQKRSVFELSSLMALSTVRQLPANLRRLSKSARFAARRTGGVFAGALLDHYRDTLTEIRQEGFLAYWRREFRPYLAGAVAQFAPERISLTQRLLEKYQLR